MKIYIVYEIDSCGNVILKKAFLDKEIAESYALIGDYIDEVEMDK